MTSRILPVALLLNVGLCAAGQVYKFEAGSESSQDAHVLGGLTFAGDQALIANRCDVNGSCSLILFAIEADTLRKVNEMQTHLLPSSPLHVSLENQLIAGNTLYSVPALKPEGRIPDRTTVIANDGGSFGISGADGWCIAPLRGSEGCAATNSGRLLALSATTAVVEREGTIQVRSSKNTDELTALKRGKCPVQAAILRNGDIAISQCQQTLLRTPEGKAKRTLERVVLPFDEVQTDLSGQELLVAEPQHKASKLRSVRDNGVAMLTLGAGAGDDTPNSTRIRVLSLASGNSCFSSDLSYTEYRDRPIVALSMNGRWLAVGDRKQIQLFPLPLACR